MIPLSDCPPEKSDEPLYCFKHCTIPLVFLLYFQEMSQYPAVAHPFLSSDILTSTIQANQLQGKCHMISKWPISMLSHHSWTFYQTICIILISVVDFFFCNSVLTLLCCGTYNFCTFTEVELAPHREFDVYVLLLFHE